MKVGFIGVGTMGAGMALNCMKGGNALSVFDTRREAAEPHINAGATWVDEPAFRDGNLVWGRVVEDIPAFCRELVSAIAG